MYRPCSFIVTVAILIMVQITLAFGAGVFSGHWKGEWRNSLGERGADSLVLREHRDGTLNGLWTGEVEVSGNRINSNTIELRGQTATRSYQITATLDGDRDEMDLKYIVTRLNAGGSYHGSSRLYRAR
jgi:hypothetical protein